MPPLTLRAPTPLNLHILSLAPSLACPGDVLCSVEDLVLRHASRQGWLGVHCEGSLFGSLFGLLFWDILFCDRPDVFLTSYQVAPLDFGTDHFYRSRQHLIAERLGVVARCSDIGNMVAAAWRQHQGTGCVGVAWDTFTERSLSTIARCLGAAVVAGGCDLLAQDYRHRRGGMPDLVLYREETACGPDGSSVLLSRACRLVEVKSPLDRLAPKQRIWLHVLAQLGADVAVCDVEVAGAVGIRADDETPLPATGSSF